MKQPTYSIIIPHKNIPELLERCLASIPVREDAEVIVVDDASDPDIVDFDSFPGYNRKDVITILSNKSGGAGRARNLGLQRAAGKWILFADSDDYFSKDFFQIIEEYADATEDVIFFNAESTYSKTLLPADRNKNLSELVNNYLLSGMESEKKLRYMFYYPYSKMVRRSTVETNKIRFDEIRVTNDVWFAVQVGHYAEKIAADRRAIYVMTVREGSLSKTPGEDVFDIRVRTNLKVDRFMREAGIKGAHYPMLTYIFQARKYGYLKVFEVAHLSIKNGASVSLGLYSWFSQKLKSAFRVGQ